MPGKVIYTLVVPGESRTGAGERQTRNQSIQSVIGNSPSTVTSVSTDPGEITIEASFRGIYSDVQIKELVELFGAKSIKEVPVYTIGQRGDDDGYYTLKSIDHTPPEPRATSGSERSVNRIHPFRAKLTRKGTRRSMWRAIRTGLYQPDNPFGNDLTAYVGCPASASKVRWFNGTTQTETATVVTTEVGEFGDINVYDANASSFTDPTLIYAQTYDVEGDADTRAWDDYGRAKIDSDGDNSWAHVYDPQHEYVGVPVVENGLVRVELDDDTDIAVWSWDTSTSSYSSVSLGASSWELWDTDILRCGDDRVDAQLIFEDTSTADAYHYLNMTLGRGKKWPMFTVPPNESSSVPQGLVDKLDPVADPAAKAPQPNKTVLSRSATRK